MLFTAAKMETLVGLIQNNNKENSTNTMNITEILAPDAIYVISIARSKKRIFKELANALKDVPSIDPQDAVRALSERETLGPTAVGRGVALPHARLHGLDRIMGAFLKLEKPLEFGAADRQPVDLIFALFVPQESNVEHLRALASVSRALRDPDVCSKLRSNNAPSVLFEVLEKTNDQAIAA